MPPSRLSVQLLLSLAGSPLSLQRPPDLPLQLPCARHAEGELTQPQLVRADTSGKRWLIREGESGGSTAGREKERARPEREKTETAGAGGGGEVARRVDDAQHGGSGWRERDRHAARRWDASSSSSSSLSSSSASGGRYGSRDSRYAASYSTDGATPLWFTGDASKLRSTHDGQWEASDDQQEQQEREAEARLQSSGHRGSSSSSSPAASASSSSPPAGTDVEATRFVLDKLGLSLPVEPSPAEAQPAVRSFADTRPAWAIQAEKELMQHRKQRAAAAAAQQQPQQQPQPAAPPASQPAEASPGQSSPSPSSSEESELERVDRLLAQKAARERRDERKAEKQQGDDAAAEQQQKRDAARRALQPAAEQAIIIPQQSAGRDSQLQAARAELRCRRSLPPACRRCLTLSRLAAALRLLCAASLA